MGTERFLVVIPQRDEKKQPGKEGDDDNSDRRSGQHFEMEMLWAKQPRGAAAEKTSTNRGFRGYVDLSHHKFHKANSLPCLPRQVLQGKKQA
jgi:hypothetical protein